jgi:hypothetical protein
MDEVGGGSYKSKAAMDRAIANIHRYFLLLLLPFLLLLRIL